MNCRQTMFVQREILSWGIHCPLKKHLSFHGGQMNQTKERKNLLFYPYTSFGIDGAFHPFPHPPPPPPLCVPFMLFYRLRSRLWKKRSFLREKNVLLSVLRRFLLI
ncbi:hypothetical protein CEXT_353591 [Caerostris extrusa]|uniref:Uncharacterized protein n=1 Tax=Caerostris extrusa TaxID=172846 RepID=A0AAV4QV78_CAEEX|nr:hypothetical protein CEXT_353591 [Caerostris extrusa]